MSTAPVTPTTPTTPTSATNGLPSGQSLNNMFLQLLVAQLQNQDPTSPVDPSQFVGQLAQFSELSEVTSIYTLLQGEVPASGTGSSGSTTSSENTNAALPIAAAPNATSPLAAAMSALGANVSPGVAATNGIVPSFAAPTISSLTSSLTSKVQGAF